jgi:SHAQKYF class myb-like DNA-binding protein
LRQSGLGSDVGRKKKSIILFNTMDSVAVFKSTKDNSNVQPNVPASSTHKLRWTRKLHQSFMRAVEALGGQEKVTPKKIVEFMGSNDGITLTQAKSHLQMLRIGKINTEGMPKDDVGDHPEQSTPISKESFGQDVMIFIFPEETREELVTLQLFNEGRVLESANAEKLLKGEEKLEDVKVHKVLPTVDSMSGRKRKTKDNSELDLTMAIKLSSPKPRPKIQTPKPRPKLQSPKPRPEIQMPKLGPKPQIPKLKIPKPSPKLQFPSPLTAQEAAISLGLSLH